MRTALSATLLLALTVSVQAAPKSRLAGTWTWNGRPFLALKEDGTGRMLMDDENIRWKDAGEALHLTGPDGKTEKTPYTLSEDSLVLKMPGMPMKLKRTAAPKNTKSAAKAAAPKARGLNAFLTALAKGPPELQTQDQSQAQSHTQPQARQGGGDDLSRLLLSSAWCSFTYNKVSGYSHTSRAVFSPNGTWGSGSRGEGYSSGYGGTMASQSDSEGGGRWAVQNGQLYMSSSEQPQLSPVDLKVSHNSNGSPILTADGKEYSSCN